LDASPRFASGDACDGGFVNAEYLRDVDMETSAPYQIENDWNVSGNELLIGLMSVSASDHPQTDRSIISWVFLKPSAAFADHVAQVFR
jgi:hypothetical protein